MTCSKSAPSADFMATESQVIESDARRNLRYQLVQPPVFYNMREMKPRDIIYLPKVTQLPKASTRGQISCIPQSVNYFPLWHLEPSKLNFDWAAFMKHHE